MGGLTHAKVKALIRAGKRGRFADRGIARGLYLSVNAPGRASWVLCWRDRSARRLRETGLGAFSRDVAIDARRTIRAGGDPIADRRKVAAGIARTFKAVAEELIAAKTPGWRNSKHSAQWSSTLAEYAFPKVGSKPVDAVTTEDVLAVLKPIWTKKPETASRLRGRMEAVLGYATSHG